MTSPKHKHFDAVIVLLIVDYFFFSYINPGSVASVVLVCGYALLVMTFYCLIKLALTGLGYYFRGLALRRSRLTLCMTGLVAIFLALQSIGQFSARDIFVIVPIATILYVYFTYGRVKMRPQPRRIDS